MERYHDRSRARGIAAAKAPFGRRAAALLVALALSSVATAQQTPSSPSGQPLMGQMSAPGQPIQINPVQYYATGGLFEVVFPNMPSGYQEKALVYVPSDSLHLGPRPVLTVFHPFGQNHLDAYDSTDLVEECRARGWFMVSPLGATKKSFSSLESQANTEFVLKQVRDVFAPWVDPTRFYGIGFSMGAGDAATYAARHLDPWDPIFAAVFLHTGGHDKAWNWNTEPATQWILEFWFGGTPFQAPFQYAQVSTVQMDWTSGAVLPGTHLGTNLRHVANRSYIAKDDPQDDLKQQAFALVQYVATLGGLFSFQFDTSDLSALPFAHSWDALDQTAACDWLAQRQLALPGAGRLRADEDAQYWWFRVAQDQAGAFTDFDWKLDRVANQVEVTGTENLLSARIPYALIGFAPGPLSIATSSADGSADEFVVGGLAGAPAAVTRNGSVAVPGQDYQFDGLTGDLRLFAGPQLDQWVVTP